MNGHTALALLFRQAGFGLSLTVTGGRHYPPQQDWAAAHCHTHSVHVSESLPSECSEGVTTPVYLALT